MHESRSASRAGVQLDWVDDVHGQGVGARQGTPTPTAGGGGYLDECTPAELWTDAKFRELHDMGLARVWLDVAREIGYDAFMRMWRVLDAAEETHSDSGSMLEIQMRRFSSWRRYQRNRFIESLVDMGLDDAAIRARVTVELGEELSPSHIRRLAKRRRVPA